VKTGTSVELAGGFIVNATPLVGLGVVASYRFNDAITRAALHGRIRFWASEATALELGLGIASVDDALEASPAFSSTAAIVLGDYVSLTGDVALFSIHVQLGVAGTAGVRFGAPIVAKLAHALVSLAADSQTPSHRRPSWMGGDPP